MEQQNSRPAVRGEWIWGRPKATEGCMDQTNHMDLDLLNVSDGFLWILMDSYGFLWVHGPWGYRHVS